nr:MAG TPA: hypothetical protein [Caudoviricetes sp.]
MTTKTTDFLSNREYIRYYAHIRAYIHVYIYIVRLFFRSLCCQWQKIS